MSNVPEGNDSEFTWESFQQTVNKDLSDVLGNFVSRVTKFCNAKFRDEENVLRVPKGVDYGKDADGIHIPYLLVRVKSYKKHMENMEFRKAATELRSIWMSGNAYIQNHAPWELYKNSPEDAGKVVRFSLNLIVLYANLSAPFIPDTARKIHEAMRTEPSWPKGEASDLQILPEGHEFTVPQNLFEKITDDQIAELSARFSGDS